MDWAPLIIIVLYVALDGWLMFRKEGAGMDSLKCDIYGRRNRSVTRSSGS